MQDNTDVKAYLAFCHTYILSNTHTHTYTSIHNYNRYTNIQFNKTKIERNLVEFTDEKKPKWFQALHQQRTHTCHNIYRSHQGI